MLGLNPSVQISIPSCKNFQNHVHLWIIPNQGHRTGDISGWDKDTLMEMRLIEL